MPTEDFAQLQLQFTDRTQWRYEVIRPVVLFADRTPQQRSRETQTHPATVRRLTRRFRQQGAGTPAGGRGGSGPGQDDPASDPVRHELDRLKVTFRGLTNYD